uniref:Uncharacterized protein n=1 Tax=Anguilla anguilla TaxID=7936 RepID=A0A0E9W6C1_ANGAN
MLTMYVWKRLAESKLLLKSSPHIDTVD